MRKNYLFFVNPPATLLKCLLSLLLMFGSGIVSAQYCTTSGAQDCTSGDRATNVTLSNLNHNPTCNSIGYNDYTTAVSPALVTAGSSYTMSVTVGASLDYVAVWIDYDHNFLFDASEYVLLNGGNSSATAGQALTGSITIPAAALSGPTRMRIRVRFSTLPTNTTSCTMSGLYGEVSDYTVTINSSAPTVPACVTTPTAPANAGSVCAGATTLSWPSVTGATGYDVYLNTGTTATTVVSTNQAGTTYTSTLAAGAYAWKIVPKNATGSATGCSNFTFTVNPAVTPSVSIAAVPSGTICAGTPVTFTAVAVNPGSAATYQWKKRTANVGTNSGIYTDNTLVSGDTISLVMTSTAACATVTTVTSNIIIPNVLPRPSATVTPADTVNACIGGSALLSANTGTGLTYQWQLGNSNIPGATSASYTATAAGRYRVVVSNGTCTDTSSNTTVNFIARPVAAFTASATTICGGNSVHLTSSTAPATGITFQWLLNNTAIPGATSNTYAAVTAGNYRLLLSNGACSDTSAITAITVNPLPTATATAAGPTALCTGGSVILNANTGSGITYKWLRNNIFITGATSASYTATITGNYAVEVTNMATGCVDTSRPAITVTAYVTPSNTLTVVGNLTFCAGSNVRFQAAAGTGYTYVWYKDSGIIPGATTSSYTATTAGIYYAVITNGPCVTTTGSRTVIVNPLPVATATAAGATAFCTGGSVVLNANTGSGLTYQWKLNTIDIPGATSAAYTAAASGAYTVFVSNGTCSNTSNSINVTVSTMPAPVITSTGLPSFCQGNSVILSTTTAPGYTYQWLLNANPIPGATAATYSAAVAGDYTVTVVNGACTATTAPFTVSVTPAPPAVITAAGPLTFCQGGSVQLNANKGTGYTYQWTRNGSNIPGATSWQYLATATASYSVDIFDGTCPASATPVNVVMNAFPVALITVTSGVDMSTGSFDTYQWYRNGVAIPGATGQSYSATRDGYYAVVVTDAAGCSATSPVQRITALDVEHTGAAATAVKIWPNPAASLVHVETAVAVDISISSVDGKQLMKADNAMSIDITHLPQGLYLIRVADHKSGALIKVDKINKQ